MKEEKIKFTFNVCLYDSLGDIYLVKRITLKRTTFESAQKHGLKMYSYPYYVEVAPINNL